MFTLSHSMQAMWRSEKQDKNPPMLRSSPKPNETPQMQGTQKQDKARLIRQPTSFPMAEAVVRMDLTAIHQILVSAQYNDDEANGEVDIILSSLYVKFCT